ncbi:MAG: NAD-dependent dehydratase, partial [Candidatus Omnitrophica bacterium CG12_big_fil_rev_8_21_14_0_65_50_5]
LVDGIYRLMQSKHPGPMNVGNPDEFTILEFARMVIELSDTKSKLVYKPLPKDDPKQRKPDITLAKSVLGWTPKVKLREGLQLTLDWFEKNQK